MNEIKSNDKDCLELAIYLKKKMKDKIQITFSPSGVLIKGNYLSSYRKLHSCPGYSEQGLPFYSKYCKQGFLRIEIGSYSPHKNSFGEKLAALSDFYEVLKEQHGKPTVFYTLKDDEEGTISFMWLFANRKEEVEKLKNGSYFYDIETNELIVIDEPRTERGSYQMSESMKKTQENILGMPSELYPLIEENLDDFVKYKIGKEIGAPEMGKIDGLPVVTYQKKYIQGHNSKK